MAYHNLSDFISFLEKKGELYRISSFADPVLEIAEITDRITKSGGKALLFENNGTSFPLLINAFGSETRISAALGTSDLHSVGMELEEMVGSLSGNGQSLLKKLLSLPGLIRLAGYLPARLKNRGWCQQVVIKEPDLGILPVLKCWPHDGGRYITLPLVHTRHPETGNTNVGMYRMQILDKNTTGMHWQRHKTGAAHYEAWKKTGGKMPVSVSLGGDPVYTYCATAPLPENINEYVLAGFLRKKKVKMVKCVTNDLYVPYDSDIVIEGYVDTSEELVTEGPFGDHTGFYSLSDAYPRFHVTCITHCRNAVYPATIVGIPPQEDAWLTKATEEIFLIPIKIGIQPEITDFHMPPQGVAHNLVIVSINKTYPGQGLKVISSLFGAGQMMFTKYLVIVSSGVDIRDYENLAGEVFRNTDWSTDTVFTRGPLDVLDHSSDSFSFGGKLGIDATRKLPEEINTGENPAYDAGGPSSSDDTGWLSAPFIKNVNAHNLRAGGGILILTADPSEDPEAVDKIRRLILADGRSEKFRLVLVADHTVDPNDLFMVSWQVLGNSDPLRDHYRISGKILLIDGTIKYYRKNGFPRKWPNVVCSDRKTIEKVDKKWNELGIGEFIESPSRRYLPLMRSDSDEIVG
jgi:4-hydroxy-3-polyprenylbenzoate decarboxylase